MGGYLENGIQFTRFFDVNTTLKAIEGLADLVDKEATLIDKGSAVSRIASILPLFLMHPNSVSIRRALRHRVDFFDSVFSCIKNLQDRKLTVRQLLDCIGKVTLLFNDSKKIEFLVYLNTYLYRSVDICFFSKSELKKVSSDEDLPVTDPVSLSPRSYPEEITSANLLAQPALPVPLQKDPILNCYQCKITGKPLYRPVAVQIKGKSTIYLCEFSELVKYLGDLRSIHCPNNKPIPGLNCLPCNLIVRGPLDRNCLQLINVRLLEIMRKENSPQPRQQWLYFCLAFVITYFHRNRLNACDSTMKKVLQVISRNRVVECPSTVTRVLNRLVTLSCDFANYLLKMETNFVSRFFPSEEATILHQKYPELS